MYQSYFKKNYQTLCFVIYKIKLTDFMGNQCCGTQPLRDGGEMGFASAIPVQLTKKLENQSARLQNVMLSKTDEEDVVGLNSDRTEEFILFIKPYNELTAPSSISIKLKIKKHDFTYKSELDWKIDEVHFRNNLKDVIVDPNAFNLSILRLVEKKSGEKYSVNVVNFDDYEDYAFKTALYEIYILQTLQQNTDTASFIVQMRDCYILENEDKDSHKGSLIILYEYCDSTLHEIIAFRKFHNWKWTDTELASIFSDLAIALGQLEALNICHRDLRPHNIWYSSTQHKYKIAGFSDAKMIKKQATGQANPGLNSMGIQPPQNDGEDLFNTVRGVPDFLSPEVAIYLEAQQPVGKYNPFLLDVYQLGLCVAMMQFLANNFDSTDIRSFIDSCKRSGGGSHGNIASKSYTDLLKMMLCGSEKGRLTPAELSIFIGTLNTQNIVINEDNLIKSMRFKKKQVGIEATRIYRLIAQAYYDLFEWEKWQEKMEEVLVTYESNKDLKNQAETLSDIGDGFRSCNNMLMASEFFKKASVIYNQIGHQEREEGRIDDSIQNYQRALDCVRKAFNGEDSYEGAMMLENLGNVYRLKGDLRKARSYLEESCRIAQQEKGEDSLEVAKVLIHLGKIYTQLADYKMAGKKLKAALKIIDAHNTAANNQASYLMGQSMISTGANSTQNQVQLLKASALSAQGELQRLKGNLDKAKQTLDEALEIRHRLQGTGHIEVASTLENMGNVYFELEDYHSAKSNYEKTLVIKKNKFGDFHPEVALTLNNIGNACKHLGEQDRAQKFFTDALQIMKQVHGNEEHPLIATTYGNLGILFKEQGNQQGAKMCLEKCTNILQRTTDQDHPDQQFYQDHLQHAQR